MVTEAQAVGVIGGRLKQWGQDDGRVIGSVQEEAWKYTRYCKATCTLVHENITEAEPMFIISAVIKQIYIQNMIQKYYTYMY